MLLGGVLAEFLGILPVLTFFAMGGTVILLYTWYFTSLPNVEKVLAESHNNNNKRERASLEP